MDLVSIIIPYYKKKNYFEKTINSISKQTYQYFEIILVYDDICKLELDFVENILKKKIGKKKYKIIINKKNIGAGRSRNNAIKFSRGKYIAFLDADDLWNKNKLKVQIEFMKKNKYLASHTSYLIKEKNKIKSSRKAKDINNYHTLLKSCDIGLSTVLLKKNIFKNKKICFSSLKTKEDFYLWIMLLKNKIKIFALKKNLTVWSKNQDSLSSSIFRKLIDSFKLYHIYLKMSSVMAIYRTLILSINYLKKNYV